MNNVSAYLNACTKIWQASSPFVSIYKSEPIETIPAELNPLKTSHLDRNISNKPPEIDKSSPYSNPKSSNDAPVSNTMYPIKLQLDRNRGMSLDLYTEKQNRTLPAVIFVLLVVIIARKSVLSKIDFMSPSPSI